MNDSKNLILAVVLSALVLLGWTLGCEPLFPDRQPAEHQGRERQAASRCRSRRRSRRAGRAEGAAEPRGGARLDSAGADPTRRRSRARSTSRARRSTTCCCSSSGRRSPRIRRRCGCCRRSARRAPMSRRSAGPARALRRPALDTRVDGRPAGARARAAGDADHARRRRRALPDQDRGRRRLSVHRQAARRSTRRRKPVAVRPIGLVSRAPQIARSGQLDRCTSGRSACSTARPITTSTGRTSTRQGSKAFNNVSRLARLHRQILADRARAGRRQ